MANFFKGSEIKFTINLQAEGFSMDEDEFDIEVASPRSSVVGHKTPGGEDPTDVVIFKETVTPEQGDPVDVWYAIVDTQNLNVGDMRVIATAYITDSDANDGVRNEIAVASLGKLVNP